MRRDIEDSSITHNKTGEGNSSGSAMRNRILVLTVLALLVFTLTIEFRRVKAIALSSNVDCQETDSDPCFNVVAVDDNSLNLTLYRWRRLPHFPIDYSGSLLDSDDISLSGTTETTDSVTSTIPEFQPSFIMPLLLCAISLGLIACKKKRMV